MSPALPPLELVVAGGAEQYTTPGERFDTELEILVRRLDTRVPQEGIAVVWTVESGDARLLTPPVSASDEHGLASARIQAGTAPGTIRIRARVQEQDGTQVLIQAYVVDRPVLGSLIPAVIRGGDTLTLRGAGFSPNAPQNVVTFSGIRGRVVEAGPSLLRAVVPSCLPARAVEVRVQLGALASESIALQVEDGQPPTPEWVAGVSVDVDDSGGGECLRLAGGRGYLVVAQSAGTVGAARYPFTLRGLTSVQASPAQPAGAVARVSDPAGSPADMAQRFEDHLRALERAWVASGGTPAREASRVGSSELVPTVGESRSFRVFNATGGFDDVRATARWVSSHAVLYVDQTAPAGGFAQAELEAFAATFDEVIHPTVTEAFGSPSDLDGNERVVILFTPSVNRLTPAGSDGFVGGFFFGLDLLDREGSNRGEIFYALVPDSAGQFSDPRPRDLVLRVTPAVLAHEFQHMVHFNERVLERGAEGTEALWLAEGLAQMAEELVARALVAGGAVASVEDYRAGNRTRARRFLADPGGVSLIVATGQGTLAERGAGWLYTLYLWDRWRDQDVLRRLTQSTRTGTENVEAVVGARWEDLLADWAAALYTERGIPGRYPFDYPTLSLRSLLSPPQGYPLLTETLGSSDFLRSGSLWSSSARHYIVVPPTSGFVALGLAGEAGGSVPADAAFRLRVVPLH